MISRLILVVLGVWVHTISAAQGGDGGESGERTWTVANRIKASVTDARIDQLNNVYLVERGQIVKYDGKGKELTRYSNKLIGDEVQVDVTNPMKVLVFSANQMRLLFLDSRLYDFHEEINLFSEGYEQISLAATSHSNGFWLYDPIQFQLIRYDQFFKKERTSLNIAQLLRVEFYPVDLIEVDNRVYLTDPKHGIYVFDVFGNYLRRIPLKGIRALRIANKRLFFQRGSALFALHLIDGSEERVKLDTELDVGFDVNRTRIIGTSEKEVIIFEPKP